MKYKIHWFDGNEWKNSDEYEHPVSESTIKEMLEKEYNRGFEEGDDQRGMILEREYWNGNTGTVTIAKKQKLERKRRL